MKKNCGKNNQVNLCSLTVTVLRSWSVDRLVCLHLVCLTATSIAFFSLTKVRVKYNYLLRLVNINSKQYKLQLGKYNRIACKQSFICTFTK